MKSTSCMHLNLLIERGVERARSKIRNCFLDQELDMKLVYKENEPEKNRKNKK